MAKKSPSKFVKIHEIIKVIMMLNELHRDCAKDSPMLPQYAAHIDRDTLGRLLELIVLHDLIVNERRSLKLGAFHFSITERRGNLMAGDTPVYNMHCSVKQTYWQRVRETKETHCLPLEADAPLPSEIFPQGTLADAEIDARQTLERLRAESDEAAALYRHFVKQSS